MRPFLALALCIPLWAGETLTLTSGAQMRADRHETAGDVLRLFQKSGVTEIPSALVASIEIDEAIAPSPEVRPVVEPVQIPIPVRRSMDPKSLVREAAVHNGLPPAFVESVARAESAFRPDALSNKGAIGVMQLMPETAKSLGADPHNLEQNIAAGARLLRELLVKYDGDVVKALAAYNAGEAAVERFNGLPPFDETRRYVNRVIGYYQDAR